MTNVLVTGGAGFLGAHVAAALVKRGENVVVLDDLSGGLAEQVPEGAQFVKGSILDDALVESLVTGPTLALRNTKRLVRDSLAQSLSEQLNAEAVSFGACAGTTDFVEGISAFLEKRPARFGGTDS